MSLPIKNCLLALALLLVGTAVAPAADFKIGRGINLDMWVTWPPETEWGDADVILPYPEWRKHIGLSELTKLKDDGFDFVRMPVDPSPFLSEATAALRPRLFQSVGRSVQLVRQAGLKVIVDLHLIETGGTRGPGMEAVLAEPAVFERYVEFVRMMAATVADEAPQAVALELMNEPVLDCDSAGAGRWPERLSRLHAVARAAAPRLTLVLSGGCYAKADALARLDPAAFHDPNLIWTFHSYEPFLLTHQGATWAGDFIRYVTGLPFPLDAVPPAALDAAVAAIRDTIRQKAPAVRRAGMLTYLDEQLAEIDTPAKLAAKIEAPFVTVAAWAKTHDVPADDILLGEFGMIRQEYKNPFIVPAAERAAYVKDVIGRAEGHGFAWSVWSYGGAFGIVEAFDTAPAEPAVIDAIRALPPRSSE